MEILYIILLGFIFANAFKIVDLVDEHKWLLGKKGFIIKYVFAVLTIFSIYLVIKIDNNFVFHFIPLFIFWVLRNKMEYPSHVFIIFISGLIFGLYFTINLTNILLIFIFTILYFMFDYFIKEYKKNKILNFILYKHLGRFYIVSLILSIYLHDYYIFLHTIIGLISMELVRYLIKKQYIKIDNP